MELPSGAVDSLRMRRIRILHVVHWPKSGITRIVADLAATMRRSADSGVILFLGDKASVDDFAGVAESVVLGLERGPWHALRNFRSALNRLRPDVIHAHSFQPFIWCLLFTHGPPIVVTVHNEYPYLTGDSPKDRIKRMVFAWAAESKRVTVVCVSSGIAALVRRLVPSKVVHTVINGVSPRVSTLADAGRDARDATTLPALVAVGRLHEQKGFDLLIQACADIRLRSRLDRLVILGDGPERLKLEKLARQKGLGSFVSFLGHVDSPAKMLRNADLFVLSSRYEGASLALIEAMSLGLPVVSTMVGYACSIVKDGETGFLVPAVTSEALALTLNRALDARDRWNAIGAAGRDVVGRTCTFDNMARQYESIYRWAISRPPQMRNSPDGQDDRA